MFIHQISFKILSKVTDLYIFYKVNLCVTLIHYVKYDLHPSNSLQDIGQNHWTMKYRSQTQFNEANLCVTLIYYPKYNIPPSNSLQDIEQNHWTTKIYVTDLHIFYEVNLCATLIHYPKFDLQPSNTFQDKRQNHWTMKYRSLIYTYFMRFIFVSH